MKKIFFVIFFSFCMLPVFAQSGTHELGFNGSPLLRQLLRSTNFPGEEDYSLLIEYGPYMMSYRYFGERYNFRIGAGLIVHDDFEGRQFLLAESRRVHIDIRMGLDKTYRLSEKWQAYLGADAIISRREIYAKDVFRKSEPIDLTTSVGLGPVFGVQFYFWKNLSLSTESSFYLYYYVSKLKTSVIGDQGFPVFESSEKIGFQSVFNVPLSIFINYRF